MQEIVLPDDVKPALEWVNNRILQKMSPARKHALAQGRSYAALDAWARERGAGTVGTEWRFQVAPPGEIGRSLVPDVGFLSYSRMPFDEQELTDAPAIAPDAVVEVLSLGDREADVEEKLRVYLAAGTNVVFSVDTSARTVEVRDALDRRVVGDGEFVEHRSLPGLRFAVRELFDAPRPRRSS
ncbi:MAG TPA: Uma2 family endonuclease [Candidatus Eremiobacteraceae bacterium]|jgi:Uma2 family endonuclease